MFLIGPFRRGADQRVSTASKLFCGSLLRPRVKAGHQVHGRPWVYRGYWVYPIIDDADPYSVGCSGPAVPANSGPTAPGLAEVRLLPFRY
jgi:hypothetical protein